MEADSKQLSDVHLCYLSMKHMNRIYNAGVISVIIGSSFRQAGLPFMEHMSDVG